MKNIIVAAATLVFAIIVVTDARSDTKSSAAHKAKMEKILRLPVRTGVQSICIVDDSAMFRVLNKQKVKDASVGHNVIIDVFASNDLMLAWILKEGFRCNLIVSDYMMPMPSGYDHTKDERGMGGLFNARAWGGSTAVIFNTASAKYEPSLRASKPFAVVPKGKGTALESAVARFLNVRHQV